MGNRDNDKADGMSETGKNETAVFTYDSFGNVMKQDSVNVNAKYSDTREKEKMIRFLELEETLQNLTPAEVDQRRARMFGLSGASNYNSRYRMADSIASDEYDSPGSYQIDRYGELPYGVRTPDSIMSTGSRDIFGGSSSFGAGWRLPEKLRIVKPLEGSLTLHNWQRLAMPSLGGIFEERQGIAVRDGLHHLLPGHKGGNANEMVDMLDISSYEDDVKLKEGKLTKQTITEGMVLHPDDRVNTILTASYGDLQMSSGFYEGFDNRCYRIGDKEKRKDTERTKELQCTMKRQGKDK